MRNAGWLLLRAGNYTQFPSHSGVTFSLCTNRSMVSMQRLGSEFPLSITVFASSGLQWLAESINSCLI